MSLALTQDAPSPPCRIGPVGPIRSASRATALPELVVTARAATGRAAGAGAAGSQCGGAGTAYRARDRNLGHARPGRAAYAMRPDKPSPPSTATNSTTLRAFSIGSVLHDSPGIDIKQGNGPRDVGISIRGSNARNGFGIRNIVILEDGFPVTQPDGLSRSDLIDPHAYSAIDVYRGPSSAYFGNYATGGALNFRTRTGAQVNGYEFGSDMGSFGYFNNYMTVGRKTGPLEYSLFMSDVLGQGFIANSAFNTPTLNFLGSYALTPNDLITTKVISNYVATQLADPPVAQPVPAKSVSERMRCRRGAAPGCATVALFANGMSGATVPDTAQQAGFGRHDYRNIVGVRWDHDFDNSTDLADAARVRRQEHQPAHRRDERDRQHARSQRDDRRDPRQLPSAASDFTHFAGLFYNIEQLNNYTYNVAPGGNATLGALSSFYNSGQQENAGGRVREEIKLNDNWTGVLGADMEHTNITTVNNIYNFPRRRADPDRVPDRHATSQQRRRSRACVIGRTPIGNSAAASPPATERRISAI